MDQSSHCPTTACQLQGEQQCPSIHARWILWALLPTNRRHSEALRMRCPSAPSLLPLENDARANWGCSPPGTQRPGALIPRELKLAWAGMGGMSPKEGRVPERHCGLGFRSVLPPSSLSPCFLSNIPLITSAGWILSLQWSQNKAHKSTGIV